MKTIWKYVKALITVSLAIVTVSLLVTFLARFVPEKKQINESYEGTELSFFAADKWESEEAKDDFNDIAYFFDDVDWNKYTNQLLKVCFNPGEAVKIVKEQLHIDPAELLTGSSTN